MSSQNMKRFGVPILVLAAVVMACGLGNNIQLNPNQTASPTQALVNSTQVSPTITLPGDPRSIVATALEILPTVPYRKTEWLVDNTGNAIDTNNPPSLVAEFAPNNSSYITMGSKELLNINGKSYSRDTGGAWVEDSSASQNAASAMASTMNNFLQSPTLNYQFAGNETVLKTPCVVIRIDGTMDVPGGEPVNITAKIWVGGDGRLAKMEFDRPDTGVAIDVAVFEYNVNIQIPTP